MAPAPAPASLFLSSQALQADLKLAKAGKNAKDGRKLNKES